MVGAYASLGCMLSDAHRHGPEHVRLALDWVGRTTTDTDPTSIAGAPGPVAPPPEWQARWGVGGDMNDGQWASSWNEQFWFQAQWLPYYTHVTQPANYT